MVAPSFDDQQPSSVQEAVELLSKYGHARVLAETGEQMRDVYAGGEYRTHLAMVMAPQALAPIATRAAGYINLA